MLRKLSGKYFKKIIISFTTLIALCITGVSLTVYFSVGDAVQKMQYENSVKLFGQIVRSFYTFDEVAKSICIQLYYDADVRALMFNADVEDNISDSIVAMNRLTVTSNTNPTLHSIGVYSIHTQRFYTTGKAFLNGDSNLTQRLESYTVYPKLIPFYRVVDDTEPVFTYLFFDKMKDGHMNGGVAVNIEAGAFLDSIWQEDSAGDGEAVFLVIGDQLLARKGSTGEELASAVLAEIPDLYDRGRSETKGFLVSDIQGQRYIISYSYMDKPEMLLVSTQPYAEIAGHIAALRNSIIIITLIFMAVMLALAVMVSRVVYNPVGNLVLHTGLVGRGSFDEISYLDEIFSRNKEMLDTYENERRSYEGMLKDLWFKKLLTGDISEPEVAILKTLKDRGFSDISRFAVCVLRIGKITSFASSITPANLALFKFAVINIATEIFSESFNCYGVDIKDDHVVILLSLPPESSADSIPALASNVVSLIAEHLGTVVTASLSEPVSRASELALAYKDAATNSDYRFVFGSGTVITSEMVKANKENDTLDFAFENERVVTDAIRTGDKDNIALALSEVVDGISVLIFHNIIISMIHLTYMVMKTVDESNRSKARVETVQELNDILRSISTFETAEEFKERLINCLEPLWAGGDDNKKNARYEALVQTISGYVEKEYGDPNLCLKQISDMAKLSSKHVNHIFKSMMGASIPEYITEVRMSKAAHMLENTSMNIKEIVSRVGIENQTYFYSMFKKKYGMSPKTYRLNYLFRQHEN